MKASILSFNSTSKAEWLEKIKTDLKGKSIDGLSWTPYSEIVYWPFYHQDDVNHRPSAMSNQKAADGVRSFSEYLQKHDYNHQDINCSFRKGNVESVVDLFPNAKFFHIKSKIRSNPVLDIAKQLYQANQVIVANLDFHKNISFNVSLDDSFYLNVIKIRALRSLWQFILSEYHLDKLYSYIIAYTNQHSLSDDADLNKIKAATHAMSAAIAGVDELLIAPSDLGDSTNFSRRIARNVQHLLQLESYMTRVKDPVLGSYFFESMTDQFTGEVWEQFQNLF